MIFLSFSLSLLNAADAACPSAYSANDCLDAGAHPYCSLSSTTFSCSPSLGTSTVDTSEYATSKASDSTYNVYGTDSDGAKFCCSVAASSVTYLVVTAGNGDDILAESYGGTESLCGISGGQGLTVTVYGGTGEDLISGTPATGCTTIWETFYGQAGGDTIEGFGRTVTIYGEANGAWGDWLIDAGDASDSATFAAALYGGDGADMLESDNDLGTFMAGGDGADLFFGGSGPDEMHGAAGADEMSGGPGNDSMYGEAGNDIIAGEAGTDTLYGGDDNDTECGGADNADTMYGGNGNDVLDDDGSTGSTYGEGGTDTCDNITSAAPAPSCNTITATSYQCGTY